MRILTSLTLCYMPLHLAAQGYTAEAFNALYTPIEEGIDAAAGLYWDDPEVSVPVGFDFPLFGVPISTLSLYNLGEMLIVPDISGGAMAIWPLSLDVSDLAIANDSLVSTLHYATTGNAPNRIFTFEWSNVGFYNEVNEGIFESSANWQVVLYEADGAIEFRFGGSAIQNLEALSDGFLTSGLFQVDDLNSSTGEFFLGSGEPNSPMFASYSDFYTVYYGGSNLTGMPVDGQVYRFTPVTNGIASTTPKEFALFPNPIRSGLVTLSSGDMDVLDSQGRLVLSLNSNERTFDVSGWNAGVYLVTDGINTARLLVQ